MPMISAITPQKNKNRLNIFIDGEFYCGLSVSTAAAFCFRIGKEVSLSALRESIADSEKRRALEKALGYISRKMRTEHELRKYLNEKGFDDEAIEGALERMRQLDFVGDKKYAAMFVESQKSRHGIMSLRQKMNALGLDGETVKDALDTVGSQAAAAVVLGEKYMRSKEYSRETRQKLLRHLASKGFLFDDCKTAAEQIFKNAQDELDEWGYTPED